MDDEKIVSRDALPDNRPEALSKKDYTTSELAAATSTVCFENERIKKLTATEYNQWYAGSCVPHAFYTQLEYEGIVSEDFEPSQLRAYRKRINYPGPGSIGPDMYDQIRGGQSNDFPTSPKFTEEMATAMKYVVGDKLIEDFKYFQYLDKATGRILHDDIAVDIAQGKAVSIFIYATDEEWSKEYVEIIDYDLNLDDAAVRHAVCLIPTGDFTTDENGKRWLAVHDSAKFGKRHLRYIEFDLFFKTRCYFAAKVYKTKDLETPPVNSEVKPLTVCSLNDKGQAVRDLQSFLVKEGKLKSSYITGFYGAITAKAVLWWQLEHWDKFNVDIPQLIEWGGEYWGNQSINIIK